MISIPVDSINTFMAKPKNNEQLAVWPLGLKVGLWIIGGLLTIIGGLIVVIWDDTRDKFASLNTTMSILSISQKTYGESIIRLEEITNNLIDRTKSLERVVYEAKAASMGFKKAEIVRTGLGVNTKFESRTPGQKGEYFISYTILAYDPVKSNLQLRFDAQLPNGSKFENNILLIQIKSGEVVELTKFFIKNAVPKIYLQVLDIPVRDQAILAIGHKQDESGKPS